MSRKQPKGTVRIEKVPDSILYQVRSVSRDGTIRMDNIVGLKEAKSFAEFRSKQYGPRKKLRIYKTF